MKDLDSGVLAEIQKPSKNKPVGELILYHMRSRNLKQVNLATRSRIEPSKLNKIIKNTIFSPNVQDLIAISLALQLSHDDVTELLTRAGRALSPAFEEHCAYENLLELYACMDPSYCPEAEFLGNANKYLLNLGMAPFPPPCGKYIHQGLSEKELKETNR